MRPSHLPTAIISIALLTALLSTPTGVAASTERRCGVSGTSGNDVWIVRQWPSGAHEISPDALVCGGPGDDAIRTPDVPFRGRFIGGNGRDSIGWLAPNGRFDGGRADDRVDSMIGGLFSGGAGADRVRRFSGGIFRGGRGPNHVGGTPIIMEVRRHLAQRVQAQAMPRIWAVKAWTWSNGSLGCPLPGHVYAQVITHGLRLDLVAGHDRYTYHTDTGTRAVLVVAGGCETVGYR